MPAERHQKTVAVRIPAPDYGSLRTLSALTHETPGTLLSRAFHEYLRNHREEFMGLFSYAQKLVANGDTEGLAGMLSESREKRVAAAMARLEELRPTP